MSTRAPVTPLAAILRRRHQRLCAKLGLHAALRLLAALLAAATLALALGVALPISPLTARVRLGLGAAAALSAGALLALRWRRRAPGFDRYLEQAEERFPELRSWLRNAVELDPAAAAHTSPALARAVQEEAARRAARLPLAALEPGLAPARPLGACAAAAGLAAVLLLVAPAATRRSWLTLLDPELAAPPVRLVVSPGDVRLSPGASLTVRARVWGTARTPVLTRDAGAAPGAVAEGPRADGSRAYRFELARLSRDDRYFVAVGRARSATFSILLAGDPAATTFEVEYVPPRYARLPVQRTASIRGDLTALRGTRARVTATFDRDLEALAARVDQGQAAAWTALTPRRWRGEVPVVRDGAYTLDAVAPRGRAVLRYRIVPLPDAPPVLAVRTPEGDLDLPAGQRIPLEAWGTDDLGLTELRLVYRKGDGPWTTVPLDRMADQPHETHFKGAWDAGVLGLLPGEQASLRLELADNHALPGPQVAVSPTYVLRFPDLAELYRKLEEGQEQRERRMETVAEQARELQKSLEKMARQTEPSPSVSFEKREEVKNALERQQQLAQQLEQTASELEQSLEQAAEREAYNEELARKLRELAQLMQNIQSPEFRDALRRVQEALQRLDKRALDRAMPEWRDRHREMLAGIERTLELLKRLREEERLESAARRAEELLRRQERHNKEMEGNPPEGKSPLSEAERRDAQEAKELAGDLRQMARETEESRRGEITQEMESAAQELEQEASPAQEQAAEKLEAGQRPQARRSGQQARSALERASKRLRSASQRIQQGNDQRLAAAVREVAQDLVSLSQETGESLGTQQDVRRLAERQRDLREGTARVADSLYTLARQTPFLSEDLARALGRALGQFEQSEQEFSRGNRAGGEESGRQAGEALNLAVLELRESEQNMCQNPGAGPGGARQQLGELSEQQSELNQETRSLAQRLSEVLRLSATDHNQLQRMAAEQERIRQGLEELQQREAQKRELLGRLDEAQREMKEVEELLRRDPTDPLLEEKQQRILSRMLDAQRSLHRRDLDPQRTSRPGEDVPRAAPAPLPADLLRAADRTRAALLKAEADRYPAQFRPFIEAYLRSLNGSP